MPKKEGGDGRNRQGRNNLAPGSQALSQVTKSASQTEAWRYDANGNTVQAGDTVYHWDSLNRLMAVDAADGQGGQYGYDYQNQRRYKVFTDNTCAAETVVYLNDNSEWRKGKLVKYLKLGDRRIASSDQAGGDFSPSQYYLHNHLRSTVYTVGASGEVHNALSYNAFGDLAESFGELARTPYRFTGKETDRETGLGYFEQRYLEGHLGRFITPDPVLTLGARFTEPQRWGAYAYSRNNPVNYLDPQGESLVKAGVTFTKLSYKAYKQYRQTGKLDRKSLKEIGVDELVGIADDLNTVVSPETSFVDKIKAGADLIVGTELQDGELADFGVGKGKGANKANPKDLIGRQTPAEMSEARVYSYRKKYRKSGGYNLDPIDVADVGGGRKVILDGHHRAQAAAREKMSDVPIRVHKASRSEADQLLKEAAEVKLYE